MKHFLLNCPYCDKGYNVPDRDVDEFFNSHVAWCKKLEVVPSKWVSFKNWVANGKHVRDIVYIRGIGLLKLFSGNGELLDVRLNHNLVVDVGRALVIDRLQAGTVAVPDYQAIGTGAVAPAAGDTTLGTEIGTRVQGALSQPTAYTDRLVSTFAAGNGTGAITEMGRLNAVTVGVLVSRLTFSVVNKGASDSLQTTHDLTD